MQDKEQYLNIFQPNPGHGKICDLCLHQSEKIENIDFPCKKVTMTGKQIIGPRLVRFENGREGCTDAIPKRRGIRVVKLR